jgi:hypothetical protein
MQTDEKRITNSIHTPFLFTLLAYIAGGVCVAIFLYVEACINPFYLRGNGMNPWYTAFFGFPLRILIPPVVWFGIVSLIFQRVKFRSRAEVAARYMISLFIVCIGFSQNPFYNQPPYAAFTRGFLDLAGSKIDSNQFRLWNNSLLVSATNSNSVQDVDPKMIPANLLTLYSDTTPRVTVEDQGMEKIVRVNYGGGFRQWGFLITRTNAAAPFDGQTYYQYWQPGIYAFHSR